jgi:DNA-binding transcriptional MerR regulator
MSPLGPRESPRTIDKSPDAFRTISEVADDLDLPQHVLRFWETRFAQIKPLKRGGGRRYYRPEDVDLLKGIRQLLYGEGYTIKGVQRILKEEGLRFVQSVGRGEQAAEAPPPGQGENLDAFDEDGETSGAASQSGLAQPAGSPGPRPPPVVHLESAPSAAGAAALSRSDISRLRAALVELLECARLLEGLSAPGQQDEEFLSH